MIVIFGGAYQGKTDFAIQHFSLKNNDICDCKIPDIDIDKKCINNFNEFILKNIQKGIDPIDYVLNNLPSFKDKIIICEDVSCGLVPLDREARLFRDNTGKIMQLLCRNSNEVYRVFCGIAERIK